MEHTSVVRNLQTDAALPIYTPGKLGEYDEGFVRVAQTLFDLVRAQLPSAQLEDREGSFTINGSTIELAAAKIFIYDPHVGRPRRALPHLRDGVYIGVRADGPIADRIWAGTLPHETPRMFERLRTDETIQITFVNPQQFAYFPVMAGDDLNELVHRTNNSL
jgi:hypothetical protein